MIMGNGRHLPRVTQSRISTQKHVSDMLLPARYIHAPRPESESRILEIRFIYRFLFRYFLPCTRGQEFDYVSGAIMTFERRLVDE